jgi:hypothetical protein
MEELEISSWLILDAIKEIAEITDTIGDLQSGHWQSVFCKVEDDYLELSYIDTASSFLRHYEDKEEFEVALEKRREEVGETSFDEEREIQEETGEDLDSEEYSYEDDPENF